jgi:hypothetical protein
MIRILACLALLVSFAPRVWPQQQQLFIRVNQLGFTLGGAKTAVVFGREPLPAEFRIVNAVSGAQVFKGRVEPISGAWGQFERHAQLNFTTLAIEGRYVIEVGSARSQPFLVAFNAYRAVPDQLLDFMRQQRCGYNPFVDAVCHSFDGRTAFGPEPSGTYLNASGGWHDAGDQLKYLLTSSNATAQLLLAHQLVGHKPKHRAYFLDEFNSLGQRGQNSIPDILDEAIWGLEWMLRLHPKPDQLYHQVADVGVPFIWCSNNLTAALATQVLLYERMTGDARYRDFAVKQIDWLLGRNPWGVSMFTGIPADGVYPRDVHLFANVLMKRMVRGGLVDGPVHGKVFKSLRGVSIREPDPLAPFQDERAVYHDDVNDYSTNEPTMDGTASAILMFAIK